MECFGSLKDRTDIQRVVFALLTETAFTFFKSGTEKRVSVGSQDDFPWLEVKRDDADVLSVNGKAVDHRIAVVLLLHGLEHMGNDDRPRRIIA